MCKAITLKIEAKAEEGDNRKASGALLANKTSLVVGPGDGVLDKVTEVPAVIPGISNDEVSRQEQTDVVERLILSSSVLFVEQG